MRHQSEPISAWLAIAYEHEFVKEVQSDRDVDLAIVWGRGEIRNKMNGHKFAVHPVSLGNRLPTDRLSIFSGISGVAHPVLGQESTRQEEALERALAHQMNLIVAGAIAETSTEALNFLVQGPLLRKLLGRLTYRYYDPKSALLMAIDCDERRLQSICPRSGSWGFLDLEFGPAACYGPYPPLSLDEAVRKYELVFEDGGRLLIEVPRCALPSIELKTFYHDTVPARIRELADSVTTGETKNKRSLPPLLEAAVKKAGDYLKTYRQFNDDINWIITKSNELRTVQLKPTSPNATFINRLKDIFPKLAVASGGINRCEAFSTLRIDGKRDPKNFSEQIQSLRKEIED